MVVFSSNGVKCYGVKLENYIERKYKLKLEKILLHLKQGYIEEISSTLLPFLQTLFCGHLREPIRQVHRCFYSRTHKG